MESVFLRPQPMSHCLDEVRMGATWIGLARQGINNPHLPASVPREPRPRLSRWRSYTSLRPPVPHYLGKIRIGAPWMGLARRDAMPTYLRVSHVNLVHMHLNHVHCVHALLI